MTIIFILLGILFAMVIGFAVIIAKLDKIIDYLIVINNKKGIK